MTLAAAQGDERPPQAMQSPQASWNRKPQKGIHGINQRQGLRGRAGSESPPAQTSPQGPAQAALCLAPLAVPSQGSPEHDSSVRVMGWRTRGRQIWGPGACLSAVNLRLSLFGAFCLKAECLPYGLGPPPRQASAASPCLQLGAPEMLTASHGPPLMPATSRLQCCCVHGPFNKLLPWKTLVTRS